MLGRNETEGEKRLIYEIGKRFLGSENYIKHCLNNIYSGKQTWTAGCCQKEECVGESGQPEAMEARLQHADRRHVQAERQRALQVMYVTSGCISLTLWLYLYVCVSLSTSALLAHSVRIDLEVI
mgnify:CR=1 FL=1